MPQVRTSQYDKLEAVTRNSRINDNLVANEMNFQLESFVRAGILFAIGLHRIIAVLMPEFVYPDLYVA